MISLDQKFVISINTRSFLEWEDPVHDDKEDDGRRKHVSLPSIIHIPFSDLWGHIRLRALIRGKFLNSLVRCETEIDDLQVHLVVDEDVLKLQIAVYDALVVHEGDSIDELSHKETASCFAHATQFFAKLKK